MGEPVRKSELQALSEGKRRKETCMKVRSQIKEWLYGSCPGFAGAFPYFGTRIHFPRECRIFKLTCRQGVFERENVELLCRMARQGGTVMDVGANIGLMAAPVLQNCPEARVISFEPSPTTVKYLEKSIALSPFRSRWSLVPKAICDREGLVDFYAANESNGAFDGMANTGRGGLTRQITVTGTTLDAEWASIERVRVCAIKIDVEGAELRVLEGARQCLNAQRPPVLLEWSGQNLQAHRVRASALLDFARSADYSLHAVPGLVGISTEAELALHMNVTESFLLWPAETATVRVGRPSPGQEATAAPLPN
jgi:FkbM family methyltransferase